jgi:hypothetical protein
MNSALAPPATERANMRRVLFAFLFLCVGSSERAGASEIGASSERLKLEVDFRNDSLTVYVVNDAVEDVEISYPFIFSYGGGSAGNMELVFRPVGRRPERAEGQLCAAIQPAVLPGKRTLWAGALVGRRFDIPYIKGIFCLKGGTYDLVATLHLDDGGSRDSISSTLTRVVIK